MADVILDLRDLRCPMPVLRTRKALSGLPSGESIEVHCTDPLAGLDIPNMLQETGDVLEASERRGDVFVFTIRKS